jgi:hypothetical protein
LAIGFTMGAAIPGQAQGFISPLIGYDFRPFPLPLALPLMVSHAGVFVAAVQVQPEGAERVVDPVPPAAATD